MSTEAELLTTLISGEGIEALEPSSRLEAYLKNCYLACGCDGLPEPVTKADVLLYALVEKVASGTHPDWNQNDPSAPDYVKNRTHFEETVETVILEEQTLTFEYLGVAVLTEIFADLTDGEKVRIVWDGETYDVEMAGTRAGNETLTHLEESHESGLPFCMVASPAAGIQFWAETTGEHTVSVIHWPTVIHTIDPKYLPDDIGGGGAMVVTVTTTDGTATADKTYADVKAAVEAGQIVRLFDASKNQYFDLSFMSGVIAQFTSIAYSTNAMTYTQWNMYSYMTDVNKETKTITTT